MPKTLRVKYLPVCSEKKRSYYKHVIFSNTGCHLHLHLVVLGEPWSSALNGNCVSCQVCPVAKSALPARVLKMLNREQVSCSLKVDILPLVGCTTKSQRWNLEGDSLGVPQTPTVLSNFPSVNWKTPLLAAKWSHRIQVWVCACVCSCTCMYMSTCICECACGSGHMCAWLCVYAYICLPMPMNMCVHVLVLCVGTG